MNIGGGRDKRDRDDEDEPMPVWRCVHGLDLRINPRCYLCEPVAVGSIGCQCPPFWHGIIPPACLVHNPPRYYPPGMTTWTGDHT